MSKNKTAPGKLLGDMVASRNKYRDRAIKLEARISHVAGINKALGNDLQKQKAENYKLIVAANEVKKQLQALPWLVRICLPKNLIK